MASRLRSEHRKILTDPSADPTRGRSSVTSRQLSLGGQGKRLALIPRKHLAGKISEGGGVVPSSKENHKLYWGWDADLRGRSTDLHASHHQPWSKVTQGCAFSPRVGEGLGQGEGPTMGAERQGMELFSV